jgi:hypothetical protein
MITYDSEGERQHTICLGAAPEYGKKSFLERLEREIERAKNRYPEAKLVGIADGAESNWKFLEKQTEEQILDFYHASELHHLLSTKGRTPEKSLLT